MDKALKALESAKVPAAPKKATNEELETKASKAKTSRKETAGAASSDAQTAPEEAKASDKTDKTGAKGKSKTTGVPAGAGERDEDGWGR